MSSNILTIIVSVLVPTIGVQVAFFFFVFRRMDKMEERINQRMDNTESRLIQRMNTSDEDREKMRLGIRDDFKEVRDDISDVQTSVARLEGAVDVLRGLVERFVTVPR